MTETRSIADQMPLCPPRTDVDILVVGGGPAGLVTALGCASLGLGVTLISGPHRPGGHARDRRTAALFGGSIELMRNLGVWPLLAADCQALDAIRIIDDTGRLMRAPEVTFRASEVGLETFGYNVPNAPLMDALLAVAGAEPNLTIVETAGATRVEPGPERVAITIAEGPTLSARIAVAADGRKSLARDASGIGTRSWSYDQAAVVTWFEHGRDHEGVSTEFHRRHGPLTTVPMPGRASSLVWIESRDEAKRLDALDDGDFRRALERELHGLLGVIGTIGPRALFPLSALTVEQYGARRIALVGEAAHVIPPIGAQGLNLGFRDAAAFVDCVAAAAKEGRDIGGDDVLADYTRMRSGDVSSRVTAVDLLNRALLSPFLPLSLARGFGLYLLQNVGPLRREVIRRGVDPAGSPPRLMRRGYTRPDHGRTGGSARFPSNGAA